MNGHSPEFVEDRIRWRAGQHNLPSVRTGFWEDAPVELKGSLPADFVNPVLYSIPDCGGMATVLGANEIAAGDGTGLVRIVLDDIAGISSPCIGEQKEKDAFDILSIVTRDSVAHHLPVESGKACFAVWNILKMLVELQRR